MANKLEHSSAFNYDSIDQSKSVIVKQRTSEIKSLMRKTAQGIVEIGHKLIEVKEELPHGQFGMWLAMEFDWSHDTAINFMRVAEAFGNQNSKISEFAPSALYLLSKPSTPETAREEAIERAEKGESISYSDAKEITNNHKEFQEAKEATFKKHEKTFEELADDEGYDLPDNVDPETGEIKDEVPGQVRPERKGIGLQKAHEAIAKLKEIPLDDDLLQEGYDTVIKWINYNR